LKHRSRQAKKCGRLIRRETQAETVYSGTEGGKDFLNLGKCYAQSEPVIE